MVKWIWLHRLILKESVTVEKVVMTVAVIVVLVQVEEEIVVNANPKN
jgi:hypothetical protein